MGKKFFDIAWTISFFWIGPQQHRTTKAKIDKRNCIRLKRFYTAKETLDRVKRKPIEWEKVSANHTSAKGLMSKIYKGPK